MNINDEVINLKKKIDLLTPKRDKLQGAEETIQKELKDKFKKSTVEEADKAGEIWKIESENIEVEMKKLIEEVKEEFKELLTLAK